MHKLYSNEKGNFYYNVRIKGHKTDLLQIKKPFLTKYLYDFLIYIFCGKNYKKKRVKTVKYM